MTATRATEKAGCRPDSGHVGQRNLFPLPEVAEIPFERSGLSRRCKQRADRRRHLHQDIGSALSALN